MNKYQVMPQVVIYRDMFDKQELQKFYDLMDLYENDTSQFAITHEELSTRGDNHGVLPQEKEDVSPLNEWVPWHTFGKKTFFNSKQKPSSIEDENIEFPNISFTSIIHMPSADFQKICRDFNALAEKLEITSSNSDLIFRCVGDFVDGETVIMSNNQGSIEVQRNTNEIVQGVFELKYLVLFTKCTNLCASTQIHLKNDLPLVLRYMVANLGEVRLVLAPQKQKTELSVSHRAAQKM